MGTPSSFSSPFFDYLATLPPEKQKQVLGARQYQFGFLKNQHLINQVWIDYEASYSVTEMNLALQCCHIIMQACNIKQPDSCLITDATACVGGNTIAFASIFHDVMAVELDPRKHAFLLHNLQVLGHPLNLGDVRCILGDCLEAIPLHGVRDVIFFDAPWGGKSYDDHHTQKLAIGGLGMPEVCYNVKGFCKYIALKVPFNFDFQDFDARTSSFLVKLSHHEMGYNRAKKRCKFVLLVYQCMPHVTDSLMK
jgi:protein-L-isoaspartate O-methyltransferase